MVARLDDQFRSAYVLRPLLVRMKFRAPSCLLQSDQVSGYGIVHFEHAVVVAPLQVEEGVLEGVRGRRSGVHAYV